jgi:hypothetical protein
MSCFTPGTMVLTAAGEVPVETLKEGNTIVTASGAVRPVRAVQSRHIDCPPYPQGEQVWPVRVAAGAFGPQTPSRDLLLAPGHAVAVSKGDAVLIPVGRLVNGATIQQLPVDEVTYHQIELDTPDVLVVNGVPATSYVDEASRAACNTAGGKAAPLHLAELDGAHRQAADIIHAVRDRLAARAVAAGWQLETRLLMQAQVDGVVVEPQFHEGAARFLVPAGTREIRLIAAASSPREIEGTSDTRRLGVMISGLAVDDGLTPRREAGAADARLDEGCFELEHDPEGRAFRWTHAEVPLPASLWEGCEGFFFLYVSVLGGRPYWVAPAASSLQHVSGL